MATGDYIVLADLKAYLGLTVTTYDPFLATCITSASRAIDKYCQRKFWLDSVVVARTFVPDTLLDLDLGPGNDIGSTTGLIVKTDPSGTGNFTITWASTDYQLLPQNAPSASPEAKPWTALRAVGTKTFPWLINTWLTHLDRIQITALWGWPVAVPSDVVQATYIKAARLFHRKDSPQGIAGFNDFGPVRLSRGEDGDVMSLLDGYRYLPILVR